MVSGLLQRYCLLTDMAMNWAAHTTGRLGEVHAYFGSFNLNLQVWHGSVGAFELIIDKCTSNVEA
jgi:hypothetical protein